MAKTIPFLLGGRRTFRSEPSAAELATLIAEAETVVYLTVDEARELGGFLKRIVPNCLIYRGWYGCTLDNVKTLYLPAGDGR